MKNILNKIGKGLMLPLAFAGINHLSANSALAQDTKEGSQIYYDSSDTEEELIRDVFTRDYIFLKRMNKDSKYFVYSVNKDASYAEKTGLSMIRYISDSTFTEEDFKEVDKNSPYYYIDSKEFDSLKKLILKRQ